MILQAVEVVATGVAGGVLVIGFFWAIGKFSHWYYHRLERDANPY